MALGVCNNSSHRVAELQSSPPPPLAIERGCCSHHVPGWPLLPPLSPLCELPTTIPPDNRRHDTGMHAHGLTVGTAATAATSQTAPNITNGDLTNAFDACRSSLRQAGRDTGRLLLAVLRAAWSLVSLTGWALRHPRQALAATTEAARLARRHASLRIAAAASTATLPRRAHTGRATVRAFAVIVGLSLGVTTVMLASSGMLLTRSSPPHTTTNANIYGLLQRLSAGWSGSAPLDSPHQTAPTSPTPPPSPPPTDSPTTPTAPPTMRRTDMDANVDIVSRLENAASSWRKKHRFGCATDATIVTAYFGLPKSKHAHEWFVEMAKEGLLSLCTPMVIFSNFEPTEEYRVKALPPDCDAPTIFIHTPLNSTRTYIRFRDRIARRMDREAQRTIHTPDLLLVWLTKVELTELASRVNPFKSERFIWLDFGVLRDDVQQRHKRTTWPDPELLRARIGVVPGRVTMMGIGLPPPCGGTDLNWLAPDTRLPLLTELATRPRFTNVLHVPERYGDCDPVGCFIAGGLWGGERFGIARLRQAFYDAVEDYLADERDTYNLADQHIFMSLYCTRPDLIEAVKAPIPLGFHANWFFMFDYLATQRPSPPPTINFAAIGAGGFNFGVAIGNFGR